MFGRRKKGGSRAAKGMNEKQEERKGGEGDAEERKKDWGEARKVGIGEEKMRERGGCEGRGGGPVSIFHHRKSVV